MGAGHGDVTCDGVLVHADQATGGPGPAALAEVVQDVEGLGIRQPAVLQDGALALGEACLAGAAVDHADAAGLAAVTPEGEISEPPATRFGALGILAAEVFDGRHAGPS
jgi:hypothetical protein